MGVCGNVSKYEEEERSLPCPPIPPRETCLTAKAGVPLPPSSTSTCESWLPLEITLKLHTKTTDVNVQNGLWMKHTVS